MTKEELQSLLPGHIIRHKLGSDGLVVMANYGDHVIAARVTHVANPDEWDLIGWAPQAPASEAAKA